MMKVSPALPFLVLLSIGVVTPPRHAFAAVADPDAWADRVVQSLSHGDLDALEKTLGESLPEGPSSDPGQGRKQLAALLKQVRPRLKRGAPSAGEQLDAQRVGSVFRRYAFAARNGDDHILFRFDLDNMAGKWVLSDFYAGTDLNHVMRGDLPGSPNYKRHR